MSEELISKIKKTFEESIVTKQAVLDGELYQVLGIRRRRNNQLNNSRWKVNDLR